MNPAERVIVSLFCLGCLVVPIGVLLSGALEPEEMETGAGMVIYTRGKSDIKVKRKASGPALRVETRNGGKPFVERDGSQIQTDEVVDRVHHSAHEISVRDRTQRGITPTVPGNE